MKNINLLLLSIVWAVVGSPIAFADPLRNLGPLELFSRCYTHITQMRLPPNHPKRAAVIAGTLDPVQACMDLLAEANLVASGTSEGTIASPTTVNGINESLAILQNFNSLHLNFTGNSSLLAGIPAGIEYAGIRVAVDETEFALHFTHALFTPGATANQVVTGTSFMEGLRSNGATTISAVTGVSLGVQTGNYYGVRKMPANKQQISVNPGTGPIYFNTYPSGATPGGGILGTYANLALNFSSDTRQPDGGFAMPRRWAKQVFHDLLCRNVPVIRLSDGNAKVQTTNISSLTPPFRQGAACMQCHASMDMMAGVARNNYFHIDTRTSAGSAYSTFLVRQPVTQSVEVNPVNSDSAFSNRPPNGTFLFRSYDGTLLEIPVTSIADLGNQIANTNDFYACTASRYFKYFTGVTANLQDILDTNLPTLSAADLYYRNLVIQFGQNLKSSQNLQSLIRDILSSAPYKKASMRAAGP